MTLPPSLLGIGFPTKEGRHWRLWLPIFVLWPLAFILGVITLVVAIAADITLTLAGARFHGYSRLLIGCMSAVCAIRGLRIYAKGGESTVDICLV